MRRLASERRRGRALTLTLAALLGGCWYPKERGDRLEQRMDRIEGESPVGQAGDAAAIAAIREQLKRLEASIAELKTEQAKQIEGQVNAIAGDVKARLDRLDAAQAGGERSGRPQREVDELGRLRASVDQLARRLDAVEKSVAQGRGRGGDRVAGPPPTAAKPPAKPEVPARLEDKAGYLAFAREQERKGQSAVAREMYQQYATEFPTDPTAAEAHFRLGELAFGERRYRDAISAYGKVAKDFPRSDKVPDALLRTGESMMKLDLDEEAAAVLSEVPRRYPNTPAAARARKLLADLPKGNASASQQRK